MNQQPQGVSHNIDISKVPSEGFFNLSFKEGKDITLPNLITLTGTGADAKLVLNDGLLRCHDDSMNICLTAGTAKLYILKKPIKNQSELIDDNLKATFHLTSVGMYEIKRQHNDYLVRQYTQILPTT